MSSPLILPSRISEEEVMASTPLLPARLPRILGAVSARALRGMQRHLRTAAAMLDHYSPGFSVLLSASLHSRMA